MLTKARDLNTVDLGEFVPTSVCEQIFVLLLTVRFGAVCLGYARFGAVRPRLDRGLAEPEPRLNRGQSHLANWGLARMPGCRPSAWARSAGSWPGCRLVDWFQVFP